MAPPIYKWFKNLLSGMLKNLWAQYTSGHRIGSFLHIYENNIWNSKSKKSTLLLKCCIILMTKPNQRTKSKSSLSSTQPCKAQKPVGFYKLKGTSPLSLPSVPSKSITSVQGSIPEHSANQIPLVVWDLKRDNTIKTLISKKIRVILYERINGTCLPLKASISLKLVPNKLFKRVLFPVMNIN